jgi:hypothetical protein
MKKPIFIILFSICFLSLFACGFAKGKGEAEKVAQSLFNERIRNGWSGSNEFYSDLFWKSTNEKKWSNIQNLVTKAMGELKSYSLTTWKVQSKVHTSEISGTIVVLVYETIYEKGKATETLTVHKPMMGEKYSILGHNINSELIQQLIDKGIEQAASEDGA